MIALTLFAFGAAICAAYLLGFYAGERFGRRAAWMTMAAKAIRDGSKERAFTIMPPDGRNYCPDCGAAEGERHSDCPLTGTP